MAINIKDPVTDQLAREVAAETGESITDAIRVALEERQERLRGRRKRADAHESVMAIMERGRTRPTLDHRTPDEIIGYDENGLPT